MSNSNSNPTREARPRPGFFFRYLRCTLKFSKDPSSSSIGLRTFSLSLLIRYDSGTSSRRRKSSRLTFHTPVLRYCLSLL